MRGRIRGRRVSFSLFIVVFFCGTTTLPTRTAAARFSSTAAFVVDPSHLLQRKSTRRSPSPSSYRQRQLSLSSSDDILDDTTSIIRDEDAALLQTVTKEQLVQLCESCHLSVEDNSSNGKTASKTVLLQRLRDHAAKEAAAARERLQRRRRRVQDGGGGDSKERYEVVNDNDVFAVHDNDGDDDPEEEEEEAFFFYSAPEAAAVVGHPNNKSAPPSPPDQKKKAATSRKVWTSSTVTAPPIPHDVQPDANGERSVKIYSTTDQNDLTAMTSAQPGQTTLDSLTTASAQGQQQPQPWDLQSSQQKTTSPTTSRELERAKEQVIELVSNLLALSGAPAFAMENFGDDNDDSDDDTSTALPYSAPAPRQFVGFHPANVPTEWLTRASPALRAGRGQVLQDVLRQFELQAVGQDGLLGDNSDRGGGHYAEVTKVRAFLEGYRRAEVRRLARATTTMLLDELCRDGVQGLDRTLSTMVRSSDDTGREAGELNDSLVDFLNDAVRQQKRRVDEIRAAKDDKVVNGRAAADGAQHSLQDDVVEEDPTEQLWNVTMEDGQRVETLDPNDPNVQRVLREEAAKTAGEQPSSSVVVPESAPEKLLLLLTLLRERVKAEAVFGSDEKGRNLRLLAYCLRVSSNEEREQLILNAVGNSLDVSASIGTKLALFCVVAAAF